MRKLIDGKYVNMEATNETTGDIHKDFVDVGEVGSATETENSADLSTAPAPTPAPTPEPAPAPTPTPNKLPVGEVTESAMKLISEHPDVDFSALDGTGAEGRVTKGDVQKFISEKENA